MKTKTNVIEILRSLQCTRSEFTSANFYLLKAKRSFVRTRSTLGIISFYIQRLIRRQMSTLRQVLCRRHDALGSLAMIVRRTGQEAQPYSRQHLSFSHVRYSLVIHSIILPSCALPSKVSDTVEEKSIEQCARGPLTCSIEGFSSSAEKHRRE